MMLHSATKSHILTQNIEKEVRIFFYVRKLILKEEAKMALERLSNLPVQEEEKDQAAALRLD